MNIYIFFNIKNDFISNRIHFYIKNQLRKEFYRHGPATEKLSQMLIKCQVTGRCLNQIEDDFLIYFFNFVINELNNIISMLSC